MSSKHSRETVRIGSRRIDPVFAKLLELTPPPPHLLPPIEERRAFARSLYAPLCRAAPRPAIAASIDRLVPGPNGAIHVRVYTPLDAVRVPAYIYFHGGGWSTGSIADADPHCQRVCADAGLVVINVAYALAPENSYPAAIDEAYAVLEWVAGAGVDTLGINPKRIAVGGTSSGANLAAALCLMARDRHGPEIDFQYLDVPALDASMSSESVRSNGEGFILTADALRYMYAQYLGEYDEPNDIYVSPLLADDLSRLPPALIVTADCDPLRDDGLRYAERLTNAGGEARVHNYCGMIHGFTALEILTPRATQAHEELVEALERLHRRADADSPVGSRV